MRTGLFLTISGLLAAPLLAQTTTRPGIVAAFTARESAPAFVVECYNDSASAVPWPTIRRIRLDGKNRELVGGVVGSLVGTPGERFEVEPGAIHRVLFVLSAGTESTSSSPGQGLGARVRQGWILPITPGKHRLAVECLGQWSRSFGVPMLHWHGDPAEDAQLRVRASMCSPVPARYPCA